MAHISMSSAELLLKILHHERDFRDVKLTTKASPDCPRYAATVRYLQAHTACDPLDFRRANLRRLVAEDWHLHDTRFDNADLTTANLEGALLVRAQFHRTTLRATRLYTTYLESCVINQSTLTYIDFNAVHFNSCTIRRSLVRDCKGIENAVGIDRITWTHALLDETAYQDVLSRFGEEQDGVAVGIQTTGNLINYSTHRGAIITENNER